MREKVGSNGPLRASILRGYRLWPCRRLRVRSEMMQLPKLMEVVPSRGKGIGLEAGNSTGPS